MEKVQATASVAVASSHVECGQAMQSVSVVFENQCWVVQHVQG